MAGRQRQEPELNSSPLFGKQSLRAREKPSPAPPGPSLWIVGPASKVFGGREGSPEFVGSGISGTIFRNELELQTCAYFGPSPCSIPGIRARYSSVRSDGSNLGDPRPDHAVFRTRSSALCWNDRVACVSSPDEGEFRARSTASLLELVRRSRFEVRSTLNFGHDLLLLSREMSLMGLRHRAPADFGHDIPLAATCDHAWFRAGSSEDLRRRIGINFGHDIPL